MIYDRQKFNYWVAVNLSVTFYYSFSALLCQSMKKFPSFPLFYGSFFYLKPLIHLEFILVPGGEVKSNLPILSSTNLLSPASSLSYDASLPRANFLNLSGLVPARYQEPCLTSVGAQQEARAAKVRETAGGQHRLMSSSLLTILQLP